MGSLPLPTFGMYQESENECEYQVERNRIRRVKWLLETLMMFGLSLALGGAYQCSFSLICVLFFFICVFKESRIDCILKLTRPG